MMDGSIVRVRYKRHWRERMDDVDHETTVTVAKCGRSVLVHMAFAWNSFSALPLAKRCRRCHRISMREKMGLL